MKDGKEQTAEMTISRLDIAKRILRTLADHGHEAYLVGGFVRDKLLGRDIQDIDIAASATPDQVARLFPRTEPTGLKHGTVTVIEDGVAFEVTTFRIEAGYGDHRRPDTVVFVTDIESDLARRDFTMNAMAMTADERLIDPFGGARDLKAGLLRCVGDPMLRFEEDALRLLRCIRFAAEYGLTIDRPTWDALQARAPLLAHIAVERVQGELERIMAGRDPARGLRLLIESGLLNGGDHAVKVIGGVFERAAAALGIGQSAAVSGEYERTDAGSGGDSVLGRLSNAAERWALLFLLAGERAQDCTAALRALRFSGRKADEVGDVLRFHEKLAACSGESAEMMRRRWCAAVVTVGKPAAEAWLQIAEALSSAGAGTKIDPGLELAAEEGRNWLNAMPLYSMKELKIGGQELKALGARPGPDFGKLLRQLLAEAAAGDIENRREPLIARAKQWIAGEG